MKQKKKIIEINVPKIVIKEEELTKLKNEKEKRK